MTEFNSSKFLEERILSYQPSDHLTVDGDEAVYTTRHIYARVPEQARARFLDRMGGRLRQAAVKAHKDPDQAIFEASSLGYLAAATYAYTWLTVDRSILGTVDSNFERNFALEAMRDVLEERLGSCDLAELIEECH